MGIVTYYRNWEIRKKSQILKEEEKLVEEEKESVFF